MLQVKGKDAVILVYERGWSTGPIVLWVCSRLEDADYLVSLNKEMRYVQFMELRK